MPKVGVHEAPDEPGRCGLVQTAAGCVLGTPVGDLETAFHARCREVALGQREATATGIARDDVVDLVRMRRVRAGARGFENG